jgi:hypothetical protein
MLEMHGVLHWEASKRGFIAVDDLVGLQDLGRAQLGGPQLDGLHLQLEAPVLYTLLLEKISAHLLDLSDLLVGTDTCCGQRVAHTSTFSDLIWDTVDETELGRQVEITVLISDHEQGLPGISHVHLVGLCEILSNANLLSTMLESHRHGVRREIDIMDNIGALVTPVSDDGVSDEGGLDRGLPVVLVLEVALHVLDLGEA